MKQSTALDILKEGHSVFLTGPAGSGKTYLLNQYIEYLTQNNIRHAVTASTGIAATHLCGRTIHSWSGIGIADHLDVRDIKKILTKPLVKERLTKTRVLIIDEISMIHAHQLDMISQVLRLARGSWDPFGGMQIVLSGDFFQLPPINTNPDHETRFVYDAQSWKEMNIAVCYLSEQFRHDDDRITQILSDIRNDRVDENTVTTLRESSGTTFDAEDDVTRLFTHNIDVDRINDHELSKIDGKTFTYAMTSDGHKNVIEVIKKSCLAPEVLSLKEGALVMFVRNNFDAGYVNGTIGAVIGFDDDEFPIVETIDGEEITVYPDKWALEEGDETLAQITQLPLRLAWAITIHKSQGMTLDAAEIDLRKCFEYGMGYVALSRVRSLANMRLLGINDIALKVNPSIRTKDKEFQKLSKKAEKEYKK